MSHEENALIYSFNMEKCAFREFAYEFNSTDKISINLRKNHIIIIIIEDVKDVKFIIICYYLFFLPP